MINLRPPLIPPPMTPLNKHRGPHLPTNITPGNQTPKLTYFPPPPLPLTILMPHMMHIIVPMEKLSGRPVPDIHRHAEAE